MSIRKICERCSTEFECITSKAKKTQRYCSPACGFAARMARSDTKYVGQRFGNLLVLERVPAKRGPTYRCRCDCGNEAEYRIAHLVGGTTVSCGCHRHAIGQRMAIKNGLGQIVEIQPGTRFGRLTVLQANGRKYNNVAYDCQCDCGNRVNVSGRSLRIGRSQSCGCYKFEVNQKQAKRLFTKHGLSKETWYLRWMKRRRYKADRQWTREMERMLFRLQPVCVVCGSDNQLTVDHVHPVAKGGKLKPGNVVILCKSCNSAKHDKMLDELELSIASKIRQAAAAFLAAWQRQKGNTS